MFKYIVKRILLSILILFGVSLIIYALVRMMPDNYVSSKFLAQVQQGNMTQEQFDNMMHLYGLDVPILKGYFEWLGNAVRGNFGFSFCYRQEVGKVMGDSMMVSFAISLIATVLQLAIAIPLGIRAAVKQYGVFDYTTTVLTMLGISLPSFFFSGIMIKLFAMDLGWFDPSLGLHSPSLPVGADGMTVFWDMAWHLVLPIVVSTILGVGGLMRHTRTNMLEVLNADYIRTARAKGVSDHRVVYKHAFRNTAIPLVTMLAGIIPGLFGGSMIIDQVFGIPGIGLKAYKALTEGDIPFVMAYNMLIAVLTVVGIFLSDIMYAVVDPRVKLGK